MTLVEAETAYDDVCFVGSAVLEVIEACGMNLRRGNGRVFSSIGE